MRSKIRMAAGGLALSAVALIGIANHERFVGRTYIDAVGVPTIGYGTTHGVKPGQTITPERALIRLGQDVGTFETAMRDCIGDIPLYQHRPVRQRAAWRCA